MSHIYASFFIDSPWIDADVLLAGLLVLYCLAQIFIITFCHRDYGTTANTSTIGLRRTGEERKQQYTAHNTSSISYRQHLPQIPFVFRQPDCHLFRQEIDSWIFCYILYQTIERWCTQRLLREQKNHSFWGFSRRRIHFIIGSSSWNLCHDIRIYWLVFGNYGNT